MKEITIVVGSLKLAGIMMALLATRFGMQTTLTTMAIGIGYRIQGTIVNTSLTTETQVYAYADGVRDMFEMEEQ